MLCSQLFTWTSNWDAPVDSSAARIPFPGATILWAMSESSFFCSGDSEGNWWVILQDRNKLSHKCSTIKYEENLILFVKQVKHNLASCFSDTTSVNIWSVMVNFGLKAISSTTTIRTSVHSSLRTIKCMLFSSLIPIKYPPNIQENDDNGNKLCN